MKLREAVAWLIAGHLSLDSPPPDPIPQDYELADSIIARVRSAVLTHIPHISPRDFDHMLDEELRHDRT